MSRIANSPVDLPSGVEANIANGLISVKGSQGTLELALHEQVDIVNEDNQLKLKAKTDEKSSVALAGTFRALVNNMVVGVSQGFEKKTDTDRGWLPCKGSGKNPESGCRLFTSD